MDVNEFRIIIIIIGFFIILYIFIANKNNRKYKVYKTKRHELKKPINIKTNNYTRTLDSIAKLESRLYLKNTKHRSFLDIAKTNRKKGWMT